MPIDYVDKAKRQPRAVNGKFAPYPDDHPQASAKRRGRKPVAGLDARYKPARRILAIRQALRPTWTPRPRRASLSRLNMRRPWSTNRNHAAGRLARRGNRHGRTNSLVAPDGPRAEGVAEGAGEEARQAGLILRRSRRGQSKHRPAEIARWRPSLRRPLPLTPKPTIPASGARRASLRTAMELRNNDTP